MSAPMTDVQVHRPVAADPYIGKTFAALGVAPGVMLFFHSPEQVRDLWRALGDLHLEFLRATVLRESPHDGTVEP
jgi:hypothetical protein